MKSRYGLMPDNLIASNLNDVINQVFKLLPYKEEHCENLEHQFTTLLFRLTGLSRVLSDPEIVTVISVLDAAKEEDDTYLYRKAILDSCSILKQIQGRYHA